MNAGLTRESVLLLERVEAAAWRDVHASALAEDRAALGLRTRELAGAWLMAADREESLLYNRALGLGLDQPVTPAVLDELLAHYRDRVPAFAVNLSPFAQPVGLERALGARGFGTFFHHVKWARGPEPAPDVTTDLRVQHVAVEQAARWGELAARIFEWSPAHGAWSSRCVGRPGWTHYFACDGHTPVAVGALFVHDHGAWLGSGGTLPSHRRQGAQSALLARRIHDAAAQGARWLTTETAPDWPDLPGESLRNAARAGFHPAYERRSWIWPAP